MKRATTICFLIILTTGIVIADDTTARDIDRDVWTVVTKTVAESDIDGMAAVYHPDAVLVGRNGAVAIADQLAKWGRDMEQAEKDGASASVSFRFANRQDGEKAAFESGMFKYTVIAKSGAEEPFYIPFEGLLVKKGGRWLILMERQLEAADETAWNALDPAGN